MPTISSRLEVDELKRAVGALREWQHEGAPTQLHPGDLGGELDEQRTGGT